MNWGDLTPGDVLTLDMAGGAELLLVLRVEPRAWEGAERTYVYGLDLAEGAPDAFTMPSALAIGRGWAVLPRGVLGPEEGR